jgi:hypothetical protein
MNIETAGQLFVKLPNNKFNENRSAILELLHSCRQTERHTDLRDFNRCSLVCWVAYKFTGKYSPE